jgi:hypothetical protein
MSSTVCGWTVSLEVLEGGIWRDLESLGRVHRSTFASKAAPPYCEIKAGQQYRLNLSSKYATHGYATLCADLRIDGQNVGGCVLTRTQLYFEG